MGIIGSIVDSLYCINVPRILLFQFAGIPCLQKVLSNVQGIYFLILLASLVISLVYGVASILFMQGLPKSIRVLSQKPAFGIRQKLENNLDFYAQIKVHRRCGRIYLLYITTQFYSELKVM
jgi:hypothetical protein